MLPLATILHPTDFSDYSEFAFRLACALARDYNARLILLHVISPSMAIYGGSPVPTEKGADVEEAKECLREREKSHWRLPCSTDFLVGEAKEKLRQLEGQAHHGRVESQVMEGDPVDMILRTAEETNSDVIVMGTHGRTALARVLMGSVAESVLRKAPCPVLTSKPFLGRKRIVEESEESAEAGVTVRADAE
ncbi:MAG TPA: universal stress protein [Gemmataceae bacterium]|jgi:nucleotide-binding universal stress UspA family protein